MLSPNTLLHGRYRIEKLIGQGGMGAVYKARAEDLETMVAVKEATVTDQRLLRAFKEEAQRLARLRHSALPRVIEHFVEGYGHYLVMEFIEGVDLGEKWQATGQPFSVDEVLALGDQLLQVLEYLHGQQPPIIHRDIKLQNLKVMPNGLLILLDFGLAKGGLTQQNTYYGQSVFAYSIGYASPEQMSALGTDQRSDLYSVAATLWTLLTTQRPINAQVREQAAKDGAQDPMRPANELNPQVPPLVAQAITNALALNPDQRPKTALQMRQQLRAEAERKKQAQRRAQEARRQAELERLRREAEAARQQAEREKQQRKAAERSQAELERLQREAEAAREQAERERQQREAAERRQAELEKQQQSTAATNGITAPIKPLSARNPLDHLRLLWWTLVMPQQLKAYREQYGEDAERPVSKWLISSMIWQPILLIFWLLDLYWYVSYNFEGLTYSLIINGILFIGWLLTARFGHREYERELGLPKIMGVVGTVVVILLVGELFARQIGIYLLGTGLRIVSVGILGGILVKVLGVLRGRPKAQQLIQAIVGTLGAAVAIGLMEVLLWLIFEQELRIEYIWGTVLRLDTLAMSVAVGVGVGVGEKLGGVIEKSLKTGRSSRLARAVFAVLMAAYAYAFLLWPSLANLWR